MEETLPVEELKAALVFALSDSLGLLLAAGEGEGDSTDEIGRREGVRGVDSTAGSKLLNIPELFVYSQKY